MTTDPFIRHTAKKVRIQEILAGEFIKENEQNMNYLLLEETKIYRINVVAIVIHQEEIGTMTNFIIEDGSGKIVVRLFEHTHYPISVGSIIQLIGKTRIFNDEKYISPEIIKPINSLWLKVRSHELNKILPLINSQEQEEIIVDSEEENNLLPAQKIVNIIKILDKGDGVLIEDVIEKSSLNDTEEIISKMLEKGDIFQNQPGKIKVL